jgi:predicted Zn-dependent protease
LNGEQALAQLCVDSLRAAGEGEVEVYATSRDRGFARFAVGELGQHMQLTEPLAIVRVAHGSRIAEASTTRLDQEAIVAAIHEAARAARLVPETAGFAGFAGADEPAGVDPPRFAASTAQATADERVDRLAPVLDQVNRAGLVSAGLLETRTCRIAIATTRGLARAHASTAATFKVWALETPGAGGAAGYGGAIHKDLGALDLAAETERAIRTCTMSKDPGSLDAGAYDVVMEPPAVAELVEWLATITFGCPEIEQGTSPFAGRMGERLTGESITIDEDPLDASDQGFGPPFDREGVWHSRVPLLERGVARGVLYDRVYASRAGVRSTGSSLLLEGGSSVSACAVHLAPGTAASVDELIAGVDRGVYVCRLHYVNGLLEPRRAVMTGLTRDGCFLIEKGKIARAVGNLRFTDSLLEGLARCDGMTRARKAIPTWWSDAGATVVPAIRMRAFRFNGKSQERPKLDV